MIRQATLGDIPEIINMVHNFYKASHFPELAPYNKDSMMALLINMVNDSPHILLVSEKDGKLDGTICMLIFPYFINHEVMTAQDLWWWVEPEARGTTVGIKLIKEAEKLVKEKGIAHMTMMSMESSDADKVNKLYSKMGMKLMEYAYIKELV
jgi:ribosomal protein S18 acetylase RimI-like enzyme